MKQHLHIKTRNNHNRPNHFLVVRFYIFYGYFSYKFHYFCFDLGIVHSMAHPLGALYDTPHGIANAIILPTVMEYNAEATGEKYREIARAMGVKGVDDMTQEEYRKAAVDAVKQLSQDVGIPADLKDIVKREDIPFLAQSAYDDACRPGNPKETSVEDITKLYESLL